MTNWGDGRFYPDPRSEKRFAWNCRVHRRALGPSATLKGLDEHFHLLADSPRLGTACDYIEQGLRKYPFQSHMIYYDLVAEEDIQIVRVLHKSMDVGVLLSV